MTKEEMLLTAQVEALRDLVAALEKTVRTQKDTIEALEKRVAGLPQQQIVYVPAPQQTPQPYFQEPYIGDFPWKGTTTTGGMTSVAGSTIKVSNSAHPFLSAFTINAVGVRSDSHL